MSGYDSDDDSLVGSNMVVEVEELALPLIKSIWEDDRVQKMNDPNDNKPRWKCSWCGYLGAGFNATKALFHVNKVRGNDVKSCKGKIELPYKERYKALLSSLQTKRRSGEIMAQRLDTHIESHQDKISVAFHATKRLKSAPPPPCASLSSVSASQFSTDSRMVESTRGNNMLQMLISNQIADPRNESRLTMAIADMIHSLGLPFSMADDPKFRKVVALAKVASTNYKPPNRQRVGGDLLQLNYEQYKMNDKNLLLKDAEIFGLTFYGDGATVSTMPLINMLASGAHQPAACLEIADCTEQMAAGKKKDARYIADLFFPHIEELDPTKTVTDLVLFDGAANVQKAGAVIAAKFPRATVLAGAEHVTALFFADIAKNSLISNLIAFYRKVYGFFGSGARHSPYAIFQKHAKAHNGGRPIGLIRAADTRMGGHFITFLRLLRLKRALHSTVVSPEFLQLKLGTELVKIIRQPEFWRVLFLVVRAVFPALRILRLSDQQSPAMDKLYYCVRRADKLIESNMEELDELWQDEKVMSMLFKLNMFLCSNEENEDEDDKAEKSDDDGDLSDEDMSDDESVAADYTAASAVSRDMKRAWLHRRNSLVHSYSVAGWMVSPVEEIMEDAKEDHTGDDIRVVEQLLMKLFPQDTSEKSDAMLNKFWEEHAQFHSKSGPYADRDHIWKSTDLERNRSHIWHMKNSLKFTEWFGRFACRVCSKILGIGSAERAWGDVKHIKKDNRAHLSGGATEKQATIYGRHCSEKAKFRQLGKTETTQLFWEEEDFEHLALGKYGLERIELEGQKKTMRVFRAWFEEWEEAIFEKCDPVNNMKLVTKYGGLSWRDLDNPVSIYTSDSYDMYFHKSRKKGERGYQVIGYESSYNEIDSPEAYDHWCLTPNEDGDCAAIYDCIVDYYDKNPDPYIDIIKRGDEDEVQEDDGSGDEE
jgi:hypothetical protein